MGKIIEKVRAHNERVNKRLMEQAAIEALIEDCRRRIQSQQQELERTAAGAPLQLTGE